MKESDIRDYLSRNLGLLEAGLALIDVEYYLPEAIGTRGFIDVLAKDSAGRYVIVEIKRSNSTAREALHEILKYHECLKQKLALKDTEIRCVVVSTEWGELLLPFSAFVKRANFEVKGYLLVQDLTSGFRSQQVNPVVLSSDRLISPVQAIFLYADEDCLADGISSQTAALQKKGIKDFVFVVLKAPLEHYEFVIENFRQSMTALGISADGERMPERLDYMLYFAFRRLSEREYEGILEEDADLLEEVRESISLNEYEDSDRLGCMEEYILAMEPAPQADYLDIGYPAKFSQKILVEEKWQISEIVRFGVFNENKMITDKTILAEIKGDFASNPGRFKQEVDLSHKSALQEVREAIERCFMNDNPVWLNQIQHILSEIERNVISAGQLQIDILSPNNILTSIYYQMTRAQPGEFYIPNYSIRLPDNERGGCTLYFGTLEWMGAGMSFQEILAKHFNGDIGRLLFTMTWGGYFDGDKEVVKDVGLKYVTYRAILQNDRVLSIEKLEDFEFVKTNKTNIVEWLTLFLAQNGIFVQELCELIDRHQIIPGFWEK